MEIHDVSDELEIKVKKYQRGEGADLESLKDKKLKSQLANKEGLYKKSANAAAKAEKWLMQTEGGLLEPDGIEKTWRIDQQSIAPEVVIASRKNQFDLVLPDLGPYTLDYTSSGRHMVAAGRKGHISIIDLHILKCIKDMQVQETIRDVVFLHNELFFAAAQKKYTYIYNRAGTELHCLKEHGAVLKLQFLKNHFLLSSINKFGHLHYQDITTGQMVGNYRTALGRSDVIQVNSYNSVLASGHSGGTVSMWKPTSAAPLVKMLCHQGPVTAITFHPNGHLMATAGMDKKIKIWDLRKYEVIQTLPGHAKSLDFSQKGLLATTTGSFVQVLKTCDSHDYDRYMIHTMTKGYQVNKVMFRPYEDVLGIGHSMGLSSILIPGSAEPNFDSWVANPYETGKQRREKEIRVLLDKLPPESIMLDPTKIGSLRSMKKKEKLSKDEIEAEKAAAVTAAKVGTKKKKTKGRSKPSKVARKKQEGIEQAKKAFVEKDMENGVPKKKQKRVLEDSELPVALQPFVRRKKS
ncbi:probable U3 small nucleolar RNA-associated protein 7 [Rutidosis leptorrhynchoides]|uniref:probable U3 small nucleolar RNA-associated protein 7 n=1 Tax=Rutidosis leptorrhynchoides TaxID=125765 RepID=UPI003A99C5CB